MIIEGVLQEALDLYGSEFRSADCAGFTHVEAGRVVAAGGVSLWQNGRLLAGLLGPCRPIYHRYAVRLFSALAAAGAREVWTWPEPEVDGAEEWLNRLGFEPVGSEGYWRLCLKQH